MVAAGTSTSAIVETRAAARRARKAITVGEGASGMYFCKNLALGRGSLKYNKDLENTRSQAVKHGRITASH